MNLKTLRLPIIFLLCVLVSLASCKGDQGDVGPAGADGTDGADGNANVQTYVYESPSWNTSGSAMYIDMSGILTDDILENDAILVYLKPIANTYVNLVPGLLWSGTRYVNINVVIENSAGTLNDPFTLMLVSHELDGSWTANAELVPLDWVKVVIIESTNTTTITGNGGVTKSQSINNELQAAGVDVNDYYAVMDYYGLEY